MTEHRIATLLPSLTEIVASLPSLRPMMVAITHECDHPEEVVEKLLRVTTSDIKPHLLSQKEIDHLVNGSIAQGNSLYGLDEAKLKEAEPSLVFTQALCEVCAPAYPLVLSTCAKVLGDGPKGPRVVNIAPTCVQEVIDSVRLVGKETGYIEEAEAEAARLEAGFAAIKASVKSAIAEAKKENGNYRKTRVAFLEWSDPLFNGGHWIPEMIDMAGGEYRLAEFGKPSARITPEALVEDDPDVIMVAPCGFDAVRAHDDCQKLWENDWWIGLRAVKEGKVYAMDANSYYARPGPRLLQGTGIMARICLGDAAVKELGEALAPKDWIMVEAPSQLR
ncbi:unnamed protein product [Chrysoparadoxa australica]